MKIVATIEARMGSTRLPEKTLSTVYKDFNLLALVVERFKLCKYIDDICIATSIEKQDDKIVSWAKKNNIKYFRGSENDVLDRVTSTAIFSNADVIVQMGADSAYLDFQLIDELIEVYKNGKYDYVCNDMELTYPLGIYAHIVKVKKLIEVNNKTNLTLEDREDVVRYIWEHPEEYKLHNIVAPNDMNYPELRLTVDYPQDMKLAQDIYTFFNKIDFTTNEIIKLYKKQPILFKDVKSLIQHSAPFLGN